MSILEAVQLKEEGVYTGATSAESIDKITATAVATQNCPFKQINNN